MNIRPNGNTVKETESNPATNTGTTIEAKKTAEKFTQAEDNILNEDLVSFGILILCEQI